MYIQCFVAITFELFNMETAKNDQTELIHTLIFFFMWSTATFFFISQLCHTAAHWLIVRRCQNEMFPFQRNSL